MFYDNFQKWSFGSLLSWKDEVNSSLRFLDVILGRNYFFIYESLSF